MLVFPPLGIYIDLTEHRRGSMKANACFSCAVLVRRRDAWKGLLAGELGELENDRGQSTFAMIEGVPQLVRYSVEELPILCLAFSSSSC